MRILPSTLLALALLAPCTGLRAQDHGGHDAAAPDADAMPIYEEGLGPFSRAVTTRSAEAQAYFDQGIQLMYAFAPRMAYRSFEEALERDPACAMCAWGMAWARGPYLNGDMSPADAGPAHEAAERAVRLAAEQNLRPVERALIGAMATRYEPEHDADRRERLDTVYAEAMAGVWAAHPADLEAGTLYGEALMLLEPRRGMDDLERPSMRRIHRVLEDVLARDITHPGACHLYIHATEATERADKAEPCADLLGSAIPGASHINHMPSHTYNRVGRWGDAVRANQQAWHSDLKAEVGEGFAIYPSHNLHMLLFAASNDGQGAVAVQAGKDYGKIVPGGQFYHALTLLRFGRFDEVLALDEEPGNAVMRGLWSFARGYAHHEAGAADSAAHWLARVREDAGHDGNFRGHAAADLLGVVAGILEGEMLASDGRTERAVRVLEEAVRLEDGLAYDEPEPLNLSARDWLGAVLLGAGRAAEAESVYRAALVDHPNNVWSLKGLELALRAQDRLGDAELARRAFERASARSDTWIRGSRF